MTKEAKPKDEKAKKQTAKPSAETKTNKAKKASPTENATAKKAVKKPTAKKAEKSDSSSKAKAPSKPEKTPSKKKASPLDEALKEEKKLRANLGNSNYPSASKKADLKKQIDRVSKLSKEDQGKLGLGADALKTMLSLF